jgi:hypothetical protein
MSLEGIAYVTDAYAAGVQLDVFEFKICSSEAHGIFHSRSYHRCISRESWYCVIYLKAEEGAASQEDQPFVAEFRRFLLFLPTAGRPAPGQRMVEVDLAPVTVCRSSRVLTMVHPWNTPRVPRV